MNIFRVLEVILDKFLALRLLIGFIPRLLIELFKYVEELDALLLLLLLLLIHRVVFPQVFDAVLLRLPLLGHIFLPGLLLDVVGFIDWSRWPLRILIQLLLVVFFEALPIEEHVVEAPIGVLVRGVFLVHHRHKGKLLKLSVLIDDTLIDAALVVHALHALHHVVLNEVVLGLLNQRFGCVQRVVVVLDRSQQAGHQFLFLKVACKNFVECNQLTSRHLLLHFSSNLKSFSNNHHQLVIDVLFRRFSDIIQFEVLRNLGLLEIWVIRLFNTQLAQGFTHAWLVVLHGA